MPKPDLVRVRVSSRWLKLRWHGYEPDYIQNVCKGACCRSSTGPAQVYVTEAESRRLHVDRGEDGMIPCTGRCPLQEATNLCRAHPRKPFGCTASPFTVNKNGTLVCRHRYVSLKCYEDGPHPRPAYIAFRDALVAIFGVRETDRIAAHLASGGGDLEADMPRSSYDALVGKNHGHAKG
jgi:Fe-S-cluster containining protein